MHPIHVYFHIPFCLSKCPYCAFKTGVRHSSTIDSYIDKLCLEITERLRNLPPLSIRTLYLGGGTPNLLSTAQIEKIMTAMRTYSTLESSAEITSEMNPQLIEKRKIQEMIQVGVNRFSVGVQSFHDDELLKLRRGYSGLDVMERIAVIRDCGIENLNLDFIIAIPGQNKDRIKSNIETALCFEPKHLSHYLLALDEGSQFTKEKLKGSFSEIEENKAAGLYEEVCHILQDEGFDHYEISNWAKPGFECRHNLAFWKGKPYLGFGLSATSFFDDRYIRNTSSLKDYLENPLAVEEEIPRLDEKQKLINRIIRESRLPEGLESGLFPSHTIQTLLDSGLLVSRSGKLLPTPQGWLLNDYVVDQLVQIINHNN